DGKEKKSREQREGWQGEEEQRTKGRTARRRRAENKGKDGKEKKSREHREGRQGEEEQRTKGRMARRR
ncbi:hypothetical protein, partial [Salmonella enterica]|uniref:hypothetical protein n=1 Tax=Salmonella enterica TaxID=28901 RepID=UPI0032972F67